MGNKCELFFFFFGGGGGGGGGGGVCVCVCVRARVCVCTCKIVIMSVRFSPNLLCNMYVTSCLPLFPVWVFGVSFCGSYCPNVIVILAHLAL